MQIKDVLSAKAHDGALTIAPDVTVRDLLGVLADNNVGALVVSADGHGVAGIVSERDVVRHLQRDEGVLDAAVSQIMTTTVTSCEGDDDVVSLMRLMTDKRIRHVPVLDDERLVGVISIGDVVKHRIEQLEEERDHLESYVHQT